MTLALEVWWALIGIKVEHMSSASSISCCEEMSSITELNFSALLDLNVLEEMERLRKDVHQQDLVLNSNHNVETTWMESHSQCLLGQELRDLKCLVNIVPDLN
jgi:3-dehydroquinate dehydratase